MYAIKRAAAAAAVIALAGFGDISSGQKPSDWLAPSRWKGRFSISVGQNKTVSLGEGEQGEMFHQAAWGIHGTFILDRGKDDRGRPLARQPGDTVGGYEGAADASASLAGEYGVRPSAVGLSYVASGGALPGGPDEESVNLVSVELSTEAKTYSIGLALDFEGRLLVDAQDYVRRVQTAVRSAGADAEAAAEAFQVLALGPILDKMNPQPFRPRIEAGAKNLPLPEKVGTLTGSTTVTFLLPDVIGPPVEGIFEWTLVPVDPREPDPTVLLRLNDRDWLPTEDSRVRVTVTAEDRDVEAVKFLLAQVSEEKGTCLNSEDEGADPDFEFDASIAADGFAVDKRSAVKTGSCGRDESVTLHARDWGAWCRVGAKVKIGGWWYDAKVAGGGTRLTVPRDADGNRVADAWQEEMGVARGLDAAWDEADIPGGQHSLGDGISLYEKYRGFVFDGRHERLQPRRKHIFVHDPTGLVHLVENDMAKERSFTSVSGLTLRYVKDKEWTGQGSSADGKRIVNKNAGWGHRVDQHALDVEWNKDDVDFNRDGYPLPAWLTVWRMANGMTMDANANGAPGFSLPDASNRQGGSPKDCILTIVWDKILRKHIGFGAILNTLAETWSITGPAARKEFTWEDFYGELERAWVQVGAYATEHPNDLERGYRRLLQHVVVHELLHGINGRHCPSKDPRCLMSVPAFKFETLNSMFGSSPLFFIMKKAESGDPFALNETWPDRLCETCRRSIAVSDASGIEP